MFVSPAAEARIQATLRDALALLDKPDDPANKSLFALRRGSDRFTQAIVPDSDIKPDEFLRLRGRVAEPGKGTTRPITISRTVRTEPSPDKQTGTVGLDFKKTLTGDKTYDTGATTTFAIKGAKADIGPIHADWRENFPMIEVRTKKGRPHQTIDIRTLTDDTKQLIDTLVTKMQAYRASRTDTPRRQSHIQLIVDRMMRHTSRRTSTTTQIPTKDTSSPKTVTAIIPAGDTILKNPLVTVTQIPNTDTPDNPRWRIDEYGKYRIDTTGQTLQPIRPDLKKPRRSILFTEAPGTEHYFVRYTSTTSPDPNAWRPPRFISVTKKQLDTLKKKLGLKSS